MSFRGWKAEAIEFYDGLEADNSRGYWLEHKADYDTLVRAPMAALLDELAPEFGAGHIFRPNRDVRFSADKSPSKTAIAATLEHGGYVQFSAAGLGVGTGMYMMATDQLDRYRRAVAEARSGNALLRLVANRAAQGVEIRGHEQLKTAPRGYPKDHPRIDLLRNKGLIAWKEWPPAPWLGTRKVNDRVAEFLRAAQPLNVWLTKYVGDSTIVESR